MAELPFDPDDPPDDPPEQVRQPMMWRLAVRLLRDHQGAPAGPAGDPVCRACGDPWPCRPHRIARRGLVAALRDPRGGRSGDWYRDPDRYRRRDDV
ncbi:hypothetical protein SAMN05444365_105157 [Micromonospora pattaloongensis]|uniref:Uncharacterized protein n=1 Tax=Micromonospora pattaloongensis TaxID=405436 RepID=A0A1H3Q160_9ACTN|nr:hypothetical protein [Micromonospora pattaloongensis]SDZ06980.1 hypothetical protein SAMN05444365_105157 [Micromonospora pattaloongensis]